MDPVYGTVVVTTSRNVLAVKKLNDYWAAKSLFLKVRKNPAILNDIEYQEKTVKFLDHNSTLQNQPFWNNLSHEQKLTATKYLTLQEVDSKTIRLDAKPQNAQIFVVINGSVSVKYSHLPEEVIFSAGDVFGSRILFNRISEIYGENRNFYYQEDTSNKVEENATVVATAGKFATFLQINIHDYFKRVLTNVVLREEESEVDAERLQDELISEIPYDSLTEDDKIYINAYKDARQHMSADIFNLLDSYKLIPKNARTNAHYNYNVGNMGREINLSSNEFSHSVLFVIHGSLRLDIIAKRNKKNPIGNANTLTCKRKGSKLIVVKKTTMPLMLLESGSILHLSEEAFKVGQKPPSNITSFPSTLMALDTTKHGKTSSMGKGKKSVKKGVNVLSASLPAKIEVGMRGETLRLPMLSGTSVGHNNTSRAASPDLNETGKYRRNAMKTSSLTPITPLYTLKLSFERPTSYLMIPFELLEEKLNNEKSSSTAATAKSIQKQIHLAAKSIQSRIENLLPWIVGNMDVLPDASIPVPFRTLNFVEDSYAPGDVIKFTSSGSFALKPNGMSENISAFSTSQAEETAVLPTLERRPQYNAYLDNIRNEMTDSTFFVTTTAASNESTTSPTPSQQIIIDHPSFSMEHKSSDMNESLIEMVDEDVFESDHMIGMDEKEILNKNKSVPVVPFTFMKSAFSDELMDQDDSVDLGSKTSVTAGEHYA